MVDVYQGLNFMSRAVKVLCNGDGIEIVQSPVNNHRATGCNERTKGSLKHSKLTFAREEKTKTLGANA